MYIAQTITAKDSKSTQKGRSTERRPRTSTKDQRNTWTIEVLTQPMITLLNTGTFYY